MKKILGLLLFAATASAAPLRTNIDQMFLSANAPRNYVRNSGAEKNDQGVTDSSSIHSRTTTTPLFGAGSHLIDASAGSQNVDFLADNFEAGLLGQNCEAQFSVSGDATLYTAIVRINGADVTVPMALPNVSNSQLVSILFPCGTSGVSPVLRISSTGNGAAIRLDEVYIGKALSLGNFSNAELVGTISWSLASSTRTPTGGLFPSTSFVTNATGRIQAPSGSNVGFKLPSGNGNYLIIATGQFTCRDLNTNEPFDCLWSIRNSSATILQNQEFIQGGVVQVGSSVNRGTVLPSMTFRYSVNSPSDLPANNDLYLGGAGFGAGDEIRLGSVTINSTYLEFHVYRFPTTTQQSYSLMNTYWKVDANISGANPSLGVANVSTYTGITNGSLTLTNNSGTGNIAAQIGCSSTNAPTGTTCSSGDESVSVAFTPQGTFPQDVLACVSTTWAGVTGASNGSFVSTSFQIVETAANTQTIIQEGKSRINETCFSNTSATQNCEHSIRVCGNFTFTSGGQKMLRLMYEQQVAGSPTGSAIVADANAAAGQRDIHWEVYPLSFQTPAPILVGGVTSSSTSAMRIESATFVQSGTSPTSQSGNWISSLTPGGAGDGVNIVNFTSGFWSSAPTCIATPTNIQTATALNSCSVTTVSTSSAQIDCAYYNGSIGLKNFDFTVSIICTGPR